MGLQNFVVLSGQRAAKRRVHSQHGKIVAGHHLPGDDFSLTVDAHLPLVRTKGKQTGEREAVIAQLLKEGEVIYLSHAAVTGMGDEIESLWVLDGQRF